MMNATLRPDEYSVTGMQGSGKDDTRVARRVNFE
jgi:hypothetical protein